MEVFILSYKGTFLGVFSNMTAAYAEAEKLFGAQAIMSLSVEVIRKTVRDE
jgi:hypothetical protein